MENPAELDNCSFHKYYTLDLNGIHYLYDQNAVHISDILLLVHIGNKKQCNVRFREKEINRLHKSAFIGTQS